jgi:two-component system alkaline phosphatase synthesis response regulator PhoP
LDNYHILLVDDEPDILEFLEYNFKHHGFTVSTAHNGKKALHKAMRNRPDLVLLDWMMPDMDGLETCKLLRKLPDFEETLIVFLTAKGDDFSEIAAFRSGADDYIVKPVRPSVILARIESLLERRNRKKPIPDELSFPGIRISIKKKKIFIDDREIKLPKKEFQILLLLATDPGRAFSREEIYKHVWGNDIIVGERTLDVHIRKLRKIIGARYIETLVGTGYTFKG